MSKFPILAGSKIWSAFTRTSTKTIEPESHSSSNRRAIGLVPSGQGVETEIGWKGIDVAKQLLFIENKEETCCIKVTSEKFLSRSALLILRGRLIGCLYGSKQLDAQLFGAAARQRALNDLSDIQSTVSFYRLTEEFALSAAAIFQGSMFTSSADSDQKVALDRAHHFMMKNRLAGAVTISDEKNLGVVLISYYHNGKILGAYSFSEGWVQPNFDTGENHLNLAANPTIYAAVLNSDIDNLLKNHSSSLSGLGDRKIEDWRPQIAQSKDSGVRLIQFANVKRKVKPKLEENKFLPNTGVLATFNSQKTAAAFENSSFTLNPLLLG